MPHSRSGSPSDLRVALINPGNGEYHRVEEIGASSASTLDPAYHVLRSHLCTTYQVHSIERDLPYLEDSSAFAKSILRPLGTLIFGPISLWRTVAKSYFIKENELGVVRTMTGAKFLRPGHTYYLASPFINFEQRIPLNIAERSEGNVSTDFHFRNLGLVKIANGFIGVIEDTRTGQFHLLPPGLHAWDSPTIRWVGQKEIAPRDTIAGSRVVQLGQPNQFITVADGEVAVTYDNGVLRILGNESGGQRVFLLDNANWQCKGFLSTKENFDQLRSTDLLTQDRVEVDLDSTVSWRISDASLAARNGGTTMEVIGQLVRRTARATISNMVSSQRISGGLATKGTQVIRPTAPPDESYSPEDARRIIEQTLQSATTEQLEECNGELKRIGVTVFGLHIVQLKINHDDTRQALARIAVIPARTLELRQVAETEAENEVTLAEGRAKAKEVDAQGQAAAILAVAEAQQKAGEMLGAPGTTAAQLATIAETGRALREARAVTFFVPESTGVQGLFANPNVITRSVSQTKEAEERGATTGMKTSAS